MTALIRKEKTSTTKNKTERKHCVERQTEKQTRENVTKETERILENYRKKKLEVTGNKA